MSLPPPTEPTHLRSDLLLEPVPGEPLMSASSPKPIPLADKFILTSEEAAEFLGVSLRTIRYWVATRRIPYFHVGRFVRFKPADLTAFLESGRVDPLDHQQTIPLASATRGRSVVPSDS
jgi:excisionase family DNA binding protein